MNYDEMKLPFVGDLSAQQIQLIDTRHDVLLHEARTVESPWFVIAVDFSQSNHVVWGASKSASLHDIGRVIYGNKTYDVQPPYRRALELAAYSAVAFSAQQEFTLLGFADSVFYEQKHTCGSVLEAYDTLAKKFNAWEIRQTSGTDIAQVIHRCCQMTVELQKTIVLILLTDGDVQNSAKTIQAVSDASHFPLCIAVAGIGEGDFTRYMEFDDSLVERRFDNVSFAIFDYFLTVERFHRKQCAPGPMASLADGAGGKEKLETKPVGAWDQLALRLFQVIVLKELPQQFKDIEKMHYADIIRRAARVGAKPEAYRSEQCNAIDE